MVETELQTLSHWLQQLKNLKQSRIFIRGEGDPGQAIPSYTGVSQISKYKFGRVAPQPNLTAF